MKIYKVCYEPSDEFKIHTYTFLSYILGKTPEGLLFFNAKKAQLYTDELNDCYCEAKRVVGEKYDKIRESYFSY